MMEAHVEDTQPDEAPQEVTCSGGLALPPMAVIVGPRPVPEAFLRKEK